MKSFAKVAAVGLSGVVLFKLFATILFPLMGMMIGLLAMTVKLALIAAVVFFLYSMLKKRDDDGEGADGGIDVEAEEVVIDADAEVEDAEG